MSLIKNSKPKRRAVLAVKFASALGASLLLLSINAQAQIGTAIDGASSSIHDIFGNVSNLILMIGAVIGLAGGIRVFIKWQNGDQDVQKHLIGWLGACIFLMMVGAVLKLFFGV